MKTNSYGGMIKRLPILLALAHLLLGNIAYGGLNVSETPLGSAQGPSPQNLKLMKLRMKQHLQRLGIVTATNTTVLYGRQEGGLVYDAAGNAYGATLSGGQFGTGSIFTIDASNNYTLLRSLPSSLTSDEGWAAFAKLIFINDTTLLGTTTLGSSNDWGCIFTIMTDGSDYREIYAYGPSITNGASPYDRALFDGNGTVYVSTIDGGTSDLASYGSISKFSTNGTKLKTFLMSGTNGDGLWGGLTFTSDRSAVVGVARSGGTYGYGTLFQIDTNLTTLTVIHHFTGGSGGGGPDSAPVIGPDGRYYGALSDTNSSMGGGVFAVSPNGSNYQVYAYPTNGSQVFPQEPYYGRNGDFWVSSYYGGQYQTGNIVRITTNLTATKIIDFDGTNGGPMTALTLNPLRGTYDGVRRQLGSPAIYRKVEISVPEMTQVNLLINSPSNHVISFDSAIGQKFTLLSGALPGLNLTNVTTVTATGSAVTLTNTGSLPGLHGGFKVMTDFTNTPAGFNSNMAAGVTLPHLQLIDLIPPPPPCTNCPPNTNGPPPSP